MEKTNFENLKVYQLSEELSDLIWEIAARWDNFNRDTIGKQIVRSADSVGANTRKVPEDFLSRTTKDSVILLAVP